MNPDSTKQQTDGPVLREHVYDGIQEYDQKLPNWWLFTLWITVVFFLIYWVAYFQLGLFKSDSEIMDPKIADLRQKQRDSMMEMLNDDNLWNMSRDPGAVAAGKMVYDQTCAGCHGPNLGGPTEGVQFIGLPLNDAEWKYGGKPSYVFQTVFNGSPDPTKGMVAWGPMFGTEKVADVTAYVLSKQPTMPTQEPVEKPAASPVGTGIGAVPATQATAPVGADAQLHALMQTGETTYNTFCFACHGADGKGMPGNLAPSLSGSELLTGPGERGALIVLDGIEPEGKFTGVMVSWKAILSDEQIAGVLTYTRSHFGNSAGPIHPEQIAIAREKTQAAAPHRRADLEAITSEGPTE